MAANFVLSSYVRPDQHRPGALHEWCLHEVWRTGCRQQSCWLPADSGWFHCLCKAFGFSVLILSLSIACFHFLLLYFHFTPKSILLFCCLLKAQILKPRILFILLVLYLFYYRLILYLNSNDLSEKSLPKYIQIIKHPQISSALSTCVFLIHQTDTSGSVKGHSGNCRRSSRLSRSIISVRVKRMTQKSHIHIIGWPCSRSHSVSLPCSLFDCLFSYIHSCLSSLCSWSAVVSWITPAGPTPPGLETTTTPSPCPAVKTAPSALADWTNRSSSTHRWIIRKHKFLYLTWIPCDHVVTMTRLLCIALEMLRLAEDFETWFIFHWMLFWLKI